MKSSKFTITMATMLLVAAFAGIILVADEGVAAEAPDESGDYKVTYVVNGSSVVKKTTAENSYTFLDGSVISGFQPAEGYELVGWKDVASPTVYQVSGTYTLAGDVTIEPVFKANKPIIKLVYGDKSKEFILSSVTALSESQLTAFGTLIGATFSVDSNGISAVMSGFDFKGFIKEGVQNAVPSNDLNNIKADVNEGVAVAGVYTYTAVFDPIYDVSFVVDGTKTFACNSNAFNQPIDPEKANYTFMGWAIDGKIVSTVKEGKIKIPADYKFEADTVFTAVFEPVQLTITLVVGEFQTTQPALYGQAITAPGLPEGYSNWAVKTVVDGEDVYTAFDFSKPIVENVTLYAQLAEKVYTISFVSEGATIGGPYDVSKKYTIPEDPVVEGKKFVGWFVGDYKVADIMGYVAEHPEQDIVLTASFTQADAPAGPGFFETNEGKCVAVIIGVALLAFVYAVYTNMFGMKDFLTSFQIQRVKKE